MVLVEQERHPHTALTFFSRVVEGDGAFPLTVLTPVLKLESSELSHIRVESTADHVSVLALVGLTFLKMFIPRSEARSGTACRRRLVRETFANVSVLRDFPSSLHFRLISCNTRPHQSCLIPKAETLNDAAFT